MWWYCHWSSPGILWHLAGRVWGKCQEFILTSQDPLNTPGLLSQPGKSRGSLPAPFYFISYYYISEIYSICNICSGGESPQVDIPQELDDTDKLTQGLTKQNVREEKVFTNPSWWVKMVGNQKFVLMVLITIRRNRSSVLDRTITWLDLGGRKHCLH